MPPEDNPADEAHAIAPREEMPVTAAGTGQPKTIMDVISEVANNPDADVDKLEKLLAMKERLEAAEAKKEFKAAKAAWGLVAPDIHKTKTVSYDHKSGPGSTNYKHADLGLEVKILRKSLAEFGFSFDWKTRQEKGRLYVSCILSHSGGHEEIETMDGPEDHSGKKNDIQAIGSGAKYLRRYTLEAVTSSTPIDEDDDGRGWGDPPDRLKAKEDWRDEYARRIKEQGRGLTEDTLTDWCRAHKRIRENQTWRDLAEARADKMLSDWPGFIAEVTGWQNEQDEENDMDDAQAAFGKPDDDR